MLKTSFERDLNRSFLVLESEEEEFFWDFQAEMILMNEIEGLLSCRAVALDRRVQFHYDITSRQPFKRIFESRPVGYEDIRQLLIQLQKTMEQLERYLLSEAQLFLRPEYIYGDVENGRYLFCFYPGPIGNVWEDMQQLGEFILNHLDYKDDRGVKAGYEFYQQLQKENHSFQKTVEKICFFEEQAQQKTVEEPEQPELPEPGLEVTEEKVSFWNRFLGLFQPKQKEQAEESFELTESSRFTREEILSACTVMEEKNYGCTRLLQQSSVYKEEKESIPSLVSQDPKTFETIRMDHFPFTIGKLDSIVDGRIPHISVSRLHAKITKEGEGFYLEDLNSTNGTFVNLRRLQTNEKIRIEARDEIQFAEISYQFFV